MVGAIRIPLFAYDRLIANKKMTITIQNPKQGNAELGEVITVKPVEEERKCRVEKVVEQNEEKLVLEIVLEPNGDTPQSQ